MTGSDIKKARQNKGLTQKQFASMIGKTKETLNRYENGKRPIPDTVKALINLLT
jgi:transcriptional regulator with XRE-family HTH domain